MKRFLSLLALSLLLSIGARADEAVFNFNANALTMFPGITEASTSSTGGGDFNEEKSTTVNGVTLTVTPSNANTANRIWRDYNLGLQLRVYGGALIITAPEGKNVTAIAFNTSTWNAPSASSGLVSENRWSGGANSVTLTIEGQIRINSITVTFGEGGVVEPDPDITQLDNLGDINSLDDGTEFQFMAETFVNYQNGNYLYLQHANADGDCFVALLYGDFGKTYQMGDIIPAGWKGKKTTYKSLVEVINVTGLQDANGQIDEYWYEPFDYTGYLNTIDETFVNYKLSFEKIHVSDISAGNFTLSETVTQQDGDGSSEVTTTLAGYNKFGIEMPEEEGNYYVEGILSIFNGNLQFYPIAIEATQTELWKIWYLGEDDDIYIVDEDIYVDYIDEDNHLIYITDNATLITNDLYAEYGYVWDEEWSPDWFAIDCNSDTNLFNTIKGMSIIKGGTMQVKLKDMLTNPRLVVHNAPEASDSEYPEIAYRSTNLNEEFYPSGGEILMVTGTYNDGKFEGNVTPSEDNPYTQSIDFFAEGDAKDAEFTNGTTYEVKAIVLQKEPFEIESGDEPVITAPALTKSTKPSLNKVPKKLAPRRISYYDPDWFTNYEIHAISVNNQLTSVTDLNTQKKVAGVTYINTMGQKAGTAFDGVNIIVTRYTDGTQATAKMVK